MCASSNALWRTSSDNPARVGVGNFTRKRHMSAEVSDRRNAWRRITLDVDATEGNREVTRGKALIKISQMTFVVTEVN